MTPQEINAAILLSHSQVKPEFIPHDGSTIANLIVIVAQRIPPADGAICLNCNYPYEEHAAFGDWCPNVWSEDSDWSTTKKFMEAL
jgi:hypothetical protein